MNQKQAFLDSEGDAWWARNRDAVRYDKHDPVVRAVRDLPMEPASILEIGCANGGRLECLRQQTDARVAGVDPSNLALAEGRSRYPQVMLFRGTAEDLPLEMTGWDVVVFGFCLYLVDRGDLFKVAAEADRMLSANGYLIIYDFCPRDPWSLPYHHVEGIRSYKMDYSKLFTASPSYREVSRREVGAEASVITLFKSDCGA